MVYSIGTAAVRRLHRHSPAMTAHRPRTTGFSLIELMVVVAIISILAAMVAPDINRSRTEAEIGNAAAALVRLGARARAHATYTGLAHTVAFLPALGDGQPGVVLARGTNSRCNSVVWNFANLMGVDADNNDVVLRAGRDTYNGMQIRPLNVDLPQICIEANGRTLLRAGNAGLFADNVGGVTDVVFSLARWNGGVLASADRQVVFPNGNVPRLVQ